MDSISPTDFVQFEYAAGLLYIPSLLFAKLAVLVLVHNITRNQWDRRATYWAATFIVLWAMAGEFAAAFVCDGPHKWDWPNGHCRDRVSSAFAPCVCFADEFVSMLCGIISKLQIYLLMSY